MTKIILLSLSLTISLMVNAGQEKIGGFSLKDCSKNICSILETDTAFRGSISKIYAFGASKLRIFTKDGTTLKETFISKDGYLDPHSKKVVLRDLKRGGEAIIDLKTGKIISF